MTNEKELTHIDLFSGIGGFTLAGEWAGFKTIAFCEKEGFCQRVLKKHWPEIPIIAEIRDFDGTKWRGATLLTGGFPCQPFSVAGKRRGKEDDRYLWPEMLRVINEAKPHWILAENVPGIFRMALDTVLADLEGEGYSTGTFIIPACGLNAPHRRNRIWIVANSIRSGTGNQGREADNQKRRICQDRREGIRQKNRTISSSRPTSTSNHAQDSINDRMRGGNHGNSRRSKRTLQTERSNSHAPDSEAKQNDPRKRRDMAEAERSGRGSNSSAITGNQYAPDSDGFNGNDAGFGSGEIPQQKKTEIQRSDNSNASDPAEQSGGSEQGSKQSKRNTGREAIGNAWKISWYEVAARFCRVDDGISDRIQRLKALGNAIVPQVAYEILKNIAWIENEKVAD